MQLGPFVWGDNGEKLSPDQVANRRKIADAMRMRQGFVPGNGMDLLGGLAREAVANFKGDQAERAETAGRETVAQALLDAQATGTADAYMGIIGNEWASPQQTAVAQAMIDRMWGKEDLNEQRAYDAGLLADQRAYDAPYRDAQLQGANLSNEAAALELELLRNPPPPAPDYGFTFAPDGTLLRTDTTSGTADRLGSYPKPPSDPLVQVNTGTMGPKLGSLSTDYGYVLDPATGEPVIDAATGLPTAAAVPGSPAAIEAARLAAVEQNAKTLADTNNNIVVDDIDRAIALIDEPGILPTTGFGADWFSSIGGTAGNDLRNLLNTVKANTAFGTLQAMREASPTGGALGGVSEGELTLLEAAKGAVEQSQTPQQLKDNLARLQNISLDIIHGPGNGPERKALSFEATASASNRSGPGYIDYSAAEPPANWAGDASLWQFMSPEDRALW